MPTLNRFLATLAVAALTVVPCAAQPSGVVIDSFSPTSVLTGQAGVVLLNGSGFASGDVVALNDGCNPLIWFDTTFISPFQLVANHHGLSYASHCSISVWRNGVLMDDAGIFTVRNRAPTITSVTPGCVVAGLGTPQSFVVQGENLGVNSDPWCGILPSWFYWISPDGTYDQQLPGLPNASVSVEVPASFLQTPGPAIIRISNPSPGGGSADYPVLVTSGALALTIAQPAGPGSVRIRNTCGDPGATYVTAISFAEENSLMPGTGWWGGLHISLFDLAQQVTLGVPPFVGDLDAEGGSLYVLPGGSLRPDLGTVYAITRTLGPGVFAILETSPVVSLALQ